MQTLAEKRLFVQNKTEQMSTALAARGNHFGLHFGMATKMAETSLPIVQSPLDGLPEVISMKVALYDIIQMIPFPTMLRCEE